MAIADIPIRSRYSDGIRSRYVEEYLTDNRSMEEFAKSKGINKGTFYRWVQIAKRKTGKLKPENMTPPLSIKALDKLKELRSLDTLPAESHAERWDKVRVILCKGDKSLTDDEVHVMMIEMQRREIKAKQWAEELGITSTRITNLKFRAKQRNLIPTAQEVNTMLHEEKENARQIELKLQETGDVDVEAQQPIEEPVETPVSDEINEDKIDETPAKIEVFAPSSSDDDGSTALALKRRVEGLEKLVQALALNSDPHYLAQVLLRGSQRG